jgi:vancomycin resistance protein YoaR
MTMGSGSDGSVYRGAVALDEPPQPPSAAPRLRRVGRRWWIALAVVVVLLVASGASAAVAYRADIDRGVTVLGVDVGAMSRAQARRVLEGWLAGRVAAPVPVRVGTTAAEISPAEAGLTLDLDATVTAAADASPGLFTALFGRHNVDPVITVDAERLYAALQPHVGGQGSAPTNPAIRYQKLVPSPVYPAGGTGLDAARAAEIARTSWLRLPSIDVPLGEVVPRTTRDDVDTLLRELAVPAVGAPVLVTAPSGDFEIPPDAIAASLLLEADAAGLITPRVDDTKLRPALGNRLAQLESPARNATVELQNGKPAILPHVDGKAVDMAALARDLLPVLGQTPPRKITAALATTPAELTSDQVNKLGITERVSTFTTKFQAGQSRVTNIKRVADVVRGTILKPGQVFSLNGRTGERTLAKGYVNAPQIVQGKIKNGPGGGASQFATTVFNAAYYAGLEDIEHKPHSYYFDRYPAVIESTTNYPDIDVKFRNDSPHGILIDTSYTATSVTVTMWGTRRYDVETAYGPRTNQVEPQPIYLQEADCNATSGLPGFAQEAWRVFKQNGKEVKRQRFYWKYSAEPKFVCGVQPPIPGQPD